MYPHKRTYTYTNKAARIYTHQYQLHCCVWQQLVGNTPQHTATHRNTPQHTATHCNTLQHTATHCDTLPKIYVVTMTCRLDQKSGQFWKEPYLCRAILQMRLGIWSSFQVLATPKMLRGVLQCVAVCCSVLQCIAVCCSVLLCVAVWCSVLRCVAMCCSVTFDRGY